LGSLLEINLFFSYDIHPMKINVFAWAWGKRQATCPYISQLTPTDEKKEEASRGIAVKIYANLPAACAAAR
jgi:hypothetical protein